MTILSTLWRKFIAPFETMQHAHFGAPWSQPVRFVRRRPTPSR